MKSFAKIFSLFLLGASVGVAALCVACFDFGGGKLWFVSLLGLYILLGCSTIFYVVIRYMSKELQ